MWAFSLSKNRQSVRVGKNGDVITLRSAESELVALRELIYQKLFFFKKNIAVICRERASRLARGNLSATCECERESEGDYDFDRWHCER